MSDNSFKYLQLFLVNTLLEASNQNNLHGKLSSDHAPEGQPISKSFQSNYTSKATPNHAQFYNKILIQKLCKIRSMLSLTSTFSLKESGKLFAIMATRIPPILHTSSIKG